MHPTQHAYALALAAYQTAVDAFNAEAPEAPAADCSDDEFEAWNDAEEACRARHGLDRLHTLLVVSEDAMVAWANVQAQRHATATQRRQLADLHARGMGMPSIRAKMVGIAFRLAA